VAFSAAPIGRTILLKSAEGIVDGLATPKRAFLIANLSDEDRRALIAFLKTL
jgi:hypothetical protein